MLIWNNYVCVFLKPDFTVALYATFVNLIHQHSQLIHINDNFVSTNENILISEYAISRKWVKKIRVAYFILKKFIFNFFRYDNRESEYCDYLNEDVSTFVSFINIDFKLSLFEKSYTICILQISKIIIHISNSLFSFSR